MSPRAIALTDLLRHELARIGRPGVAVMLGADERTVILQDPDGRWQGPVPVAYGALAVCEDGEDGGDRFWTRVSLPPS